MIPPTAIPPLVAPSKKVTPTRGRVLLVDDEQAVLRAYKRLLVQAGFAVETACEGAQAVARLGEGDLDVVVTDLNMRGLDGIGVLRAVRTHRPDVPVILITGGADLGSAIQAVEHGAFRYLLKPIEVDPLAATIDEAVRLHKLTRVQRHAYALYGRGASLDHADLEDRLGTALRSLRMVFQPIVRWSDGPGRGG